MTNDEFNAFKDAMKRIFPAVEQWWRRLDGVNGDGRPVPDTTKRLAMRDRWRQCVNRVDVADAIKVLEELSMSPEPPWGEWHRIEFFPAQIARLCDERKARRRQLEEAAARPRRNPAAVVSASVLQGNVIARLESEERHDDGCRAYRAIHERCRPGCPAINEVVAEILAEADARCPLPSADETYRCARCCDSGLVPILRGETVQAVASGSMSSSEARRSGNLCSVVCDCTGFAASSLRESRLRTGEQFFARYDPAKHVWAYMSDAALSVACAAIVESCGGRRVASFDQWNNRGTNP